MRSDPVGDLNRSRNSILGSPYFKYITGGISFFLLLLLAISFLDLERVDANEYCIKRSYNRPVKFGVDPGAEVLWKWEDLACFPGVGQQQVYPNVAADGSASYLLAHGVTREQTPVDIPLSVEWSYPADMEHVYKAKRTHEAVLQQIEKALRNASNRVTNTDSLHVLFDDVSNGSYASEVQTIANADLTGIAMLNKTYVQAPVLPEGVQQARLNTARVRLMRDSVVIAAQIDSTQNARRVQKSLADAQEKENLGRAYAANAGLLGLETAREKTKQSEHLSRICGQAATCQIGVDMASSIFGTRSQ